MREYCDEADIPIFYNTENLVEHVLDGRHENTENTSQPSSDTDYNVFSYLENYF